MTRLIASAANCRKAKAWNIARNAARKSPRRAAKPCRAYAYASNASRSRTNTEPPTNSSIVGGARTANCGRVLTCQIGHGFAGFTTFGLVNGRNPRVFPCQVRNPQEDMPFPCNLLASRPAPGFLTDCKRKLAISAQYVKTVSARGFVT